MRRVRVVLVIACVLAGLLTQITLRAPAGASPQTFTDTTTSDFDTGNTSGAVAQGDSGDGSVAMAPGSANFNGSSLPDGWTFSGSGSETVSGGQLHVDGGTVQDPVFFRPGQTLTFRAKFDAVGESIGFGNPAVSTQFVGLTTFMYNNKLSLGIKYGQSGTTYWTSTDIDSFHTFQIKWVAGGIAYVVLDDPQHSSYGGSYPLANLYGNAPVSIADTTADSGVFSVDWVTNTPIGSTTDFSSVSTPPAWWSPVSPQNETVSNGHLILDAKTLNSVTAVGAAGYSVDTTVDFWATFGQAGEQLGIVPTSGGGTSAYFTAAANGFYIYANGGGSPTLSTLVSGTNVLGVEHEYELKVTASSVTFRILDLPSFVPVVSNRYFTVDSSIKAYISDVANGNAMDLDSVSFSQPIYDDYDFSSAPTDWGITALKTGGTATVQSGNLVVNDALTGSPLSYPAGRTLDFWANFSGGANQTVGWGQTLASGEAQGTITTSASGGLLEADGDGSTVVLPSSLLGTSHHYQINWTGTSYVFTVLDVAGIAPITIPSSTFNETSLRPVIEDNNTSSDSLSLDSLQVLPTSTYTTSRIFDAGSHVNWNGATYTANTPTNAGVQVSVRAGDTPTPDASWSSWSTVANSGDNPNVSGRYAQYKITFMTSDDWSMPSVSQVSLSTSDQLTPVQFTDTTNTDFTAGTANNTDVVSIGDGAVQLSNGYSMPNDGTSPDPSWQFADPSAVSMNNGAMYVNGTTGWQRGVQFSYPRTITFNATMEGNNEQQMGFEQTSVPDGYYPAAAWFDFEPADGKMYIETNDGGLITNGWQGHLGGASLADVPGTTHNFEILYMQGSASFYVDGLYIGNLPLNPTVPMSMFAYDSPNDEVPLVINGEGVSPSTSGTFTSRVLGDGTHVIGGPASWDADLPANSTMTIQVRSGNTPTPDGSWSNFEAVTNGSSPAYGGKYAQYQVTFASDGVYQPDLRDITLTGY
jgi:hypothetical protein